MKRGDCRPAKPRAFFAREIAFLSEEDFFSRRNQEEPWFSGLGEADREDYKAGMDMKNHSGDMICRGLIERFILRSDRGYDCLWPEWQAIPRPPLPSGRGW